MWSVGVGVLIYFICFLFLQLIYCEYGKHKFYLYAYISAKIRILILNVINKNT